MTSHQIAIAKASFSAGLLRPDPVSVSRDDISAFHNAIDTMLSHCSPLHIQNCKSWLLKNVAPSTARLGGLGKFLVALAESFHTSEPGDGKRLRRASAKRKRLHILYLINDLLHHVKYHGPAPFSFPSVADSLRPYITELFSLAAIFDSQRNPKHHKRLQELLSFWESNGYYNADQIKQLHAAVENPGPASNIPPGQADQAEGGKKVAPRDVPFVMPSVHGDPNAPYHDLPAGNMLPHIIPNSSTPIHSQSVKALQFAAGPADENLVNAVKTLLKEVDQIYDSNGSGQPFDIVDVDELGQITRRDPVTEGLVEEDSYYGWSRSFCQNMKQRRDGKAPSSSSSRSQSRNGRHSSSKRRRYSHSVSSHDERGRSRSRSRSRSRASSATRARRHRDSYSPRSSSPPQRRMRSRTPSNSYSPPFPQQNMFQSHQKPMQQQQVQPPFPPAHSPAPMHFGYGQPLNIPPQQGGPVGAFSPPPRPPNYHGPWPPPPPPPPPPFPAAGAGAPFMPMHMNMPGFPQSFSPNPMGGQHYIPPPPPPPRQHQNQHQNQQPPNLPYPQQPNPQRQHQPHHGSGWNQGGWS